QPSPAEHETGQPPPGHEHLFKDAALASLANESAQVFDDRDPALEVDVEVDTRNGYVKSTHKEVMSNQEVRQIPRHSRSARVQVSRMKLDEGCRKPLSLAKDQLEVGRREPIGVAPQTERFDEKRLARYGKLERDRLFSSLRPNLGFLQGI